MIHGEVQIFLENKIMNQAIMDLEFFMDVSPAWWIRARVDEKFLNKYVHEKFDRDYYPRIINIGREKIDLDKSGKPIKIEILKKLQSGQFQYEFFPEDETIKESYSISKGTVHFNPRKTKINSRLLVKVKIESKKF